MTRGEIVVVVLLLVLLFSGDDLGEVALALWGDHYNYCCCFEGVRISACLGL